MKRVFYKFYFFYILPLKSNLIQFIGTYLVLINYINGVKLHKFGYKSEF